MLRSLRRRFTENDIHVYEVRPRKDKRGVDLISDTLPFGRLWYAEPDAVGNAISYAKFYSRSHDAVICVYDEAGNVIETHDHAGDFKEWYVCSRESSMSYSLLPLKPLLIFALVTLVVALTAAIAFALANPASEDNRARYRRARKHDAIRLDTAYRDVFVFFPVNRFEVVGECE